VLRSTVRTAQVLGRQLRFLPSIIAQTFIASCIRTQLDISKHRVLDAPLEPDAVREAKAVETTTAEEDAPKS